MVSNGGRGLVPVLKDAVYGGVRDNVEGSTYQIAPVARYGS